MTIHVVKEARSSISDVNGNMGQTKSNRVIVYTPFIDTRKIILIVMHSNQDVNRKMFFSEYCEIETKNLIKTLKYSISHL